MLYQQTATTSQQKNTTVLFFYGTRPIRIDAPASVARALAQTIEWLTNNHPRWRIEAVCLPGSQAGNANFNNVELTTGDRMRLAVIRKFKWVHQEILWVTKAVKLAAKTGIKPDLVICVSPYVAQHVRRYYPQTALIYWIHNLPAPSEEKAVLQGLRAASAVIVPTTALYRAMWQLYCREGFPPAVWIIPNQLDQQLFRPAQTNERAQARVQFGLAETDFAIIHIGGAAVNKGRKIIEQALLLCRNLDRRVVLFSAGSAQRQTRSLHPRLELAELGMLSPVELAELYRACDLGVVPSLCWENFSTATIEMMSAGLCVLAANSGGIPENLEDQHTGWLIKNPNDVTEWAAALEKIMLNDKLRQRLARNARDYAAARFGVNNLEITGKWDQLLSSWVQTD